MTRGTWLSWLIVAVIAAAFPWVFYDWAHHRPAGFVVSMLSQMGMMSILALSYNMLLGQSGLFSLCHATFFGFGGYCMVHFLNAAGDGSLPLPMELMPLLSGLAGFALAVVVGAMATRQRATAFAMITLGFGELFATAALMFHHFFGGEGGVSTDRMIGHSLFGLSYASGLQVWYLILAWSFIAAILMRLQTMTPLGRMANACRDNFERAQFVGYNPRVVRFLQFSLAGFFAGIGGGLYAITYEIVTFDALAGALSANALLMAYIGGSMVFAGPILGAVLITLLQSGISLMSNSWLIYVGVLFIAMVTFAPTGIAGIIEAHGPIWRAGRLSRLLVPYSRLLPAGAATLAGFVGVVELASFLTIGAAEGKQLHLFGTRIDPASLAPWLVAAALLLFGVAWLRLEARRFAAAWELVTEELTEARA